MATRIPQEFTTPTSTPSSPLQELPRPFVPEERQTSPPATAAPFLPEDRVSLSAVAQDQAAAIAGRTELPPSQATPAEKIALPDAGAPPRQEALQDRRGAAAPEPPARAVPAPRNTAAAATAVQPAETTVAANEPAAAPNPPAPVAPPAAPTETPAAQSEPSPERQNATATDSRISAQQSVLRQEAFAANEPISPFTRIPQPFQPLDITV